MIFTVIFKNEQEEFELSYKSYDNRISNRWSKALKEQVSRDPVIREPDRLYNFPNNEWTETKIVDELNKCIDVINRSNTVIHHKAYVGMPQEQLNHLHHYFENLRGGVLSPTEFWNTSSSEVQAALERYNVIIHRAENFYHNQKNEELCPRIVCSFRDRPRYELADADYDYFTFYKKFGEVYINYCEVGKPLYDVYKDGDDIVGEDNIRPLRYYSADFTAYFHNNAHKVGDFLRGMDEWWIQNDNYLKALGFNKGDPKNAIGNIPVAMLIDNGMSEEEIVYKLANFNTMSHVIINE